MFIHYSADNVDHNIRSADGINTFHSIDFAVVNQSSLNRKCIIPLVVEVPSIDFYNVPQIESHILPSQVFKVGRIPESWEKKEK